MTDRSPRTEAEVERALELAAEAHAGKTDKLGEPYMGHVRRVAARAGEFAPADIAVTARIVAALHDVVEDHAHEGWTFERLAELGFDREIVDAVDSLSQRKDEGEAYPDAIHRAGANPIGRWVKLADNLDNSDPERLARIADEATRTRLVEKYRGARAILAEYGAAPPAG